jgi:hypothetical protein
MHQQTRQRKSRQDPNTPKPRNRTQLTVLLPPNINPILQRINSVLIPAIRRREPQLVHNQILEQIGLHDGHRGVSVEGVVLAEGRYVAQSVDTRAGFVDAAG